MDNPNNPNSFNPPASGSGAGSTNPIPDDTSSPVSNIPPIDPTSPSWPSSTPDQNANLGTTTPPAGSSFTPPITSNPAPSAWPSSDLSNSANSAWPTSPPADPLSTPNPQPVQQMPTASSQDSLSSLDNPMGAPTQPPSIDGGQDSSSTPAWATPPGDNTPPPPLSVDQTQSSQIPPATQEIAPTDLSHLISNSTAEPVTASAETLIVPPTNVNPEVPNIPSENHKGIPKWLIGVGIGLLLVVTAASAYFIIGIGQTPKTASLPATETQEPQVKPPAPVPTPISQPQQPAATGSANFGDLQNPTTTPPPQATSAAELLKQRQGIN